MINNFKKLKLVTQSCLTLCDPMDCSPPGSSVHGILQARILECIAIPFSRGSSQPRDRTQVSCIAGRLYLMSHQGSQFISYLYSDIVKFKKFLTFDNFRLIKAVEFLSSNKQKKTFRIKTWGEEMQNFFPFIYYPEILVKRGVKWEVSRFQFILMVVFLQGSLRVLLCLIKNSFHFCWNFLMKNRLNFDALTF